MMLTPRQLAVGLVRELDARGVEFTDELAHAVVVQLAKEQRLSLWRDVARSLDDAWKDLYGVSRITVTSAHDLSASAKKALESHAKGASVHLHTDEDRLGGAEIRVDDVVFDGTLSGKLLALKQSLT